MFPASKSTLVKLVLTAAVSFATLVVPTRMLSAETVVYLVKFWGFWLIFLTCSLFLWKAWPIFRGLSGAKFGNYCRKHRIGLLLAAAVACFLQLNGERKFKILYDEHMLSSTAMNLYYQQIAYVQASGHSFAGETVASIGHVDKRPLLFPFLLALMHYLLDYGHENVFFLNGALTFILLALLYGLVARLSKPSYGALGVLLFGGLPLLAQNATGGGYEILNLCLIVGLASAAVRYLSHEKGSGGLDLMIMTAILLANVRYESILYVLVPATLFLMKSIRRKEFALTWFGALSPAILTLPLLSLEVFRNDSAFFITNKENFFQLSHLPGNLVHAITYLFDWRGDYTNSLVLSIVGGVGLFYFMLRTAPRISRLTKTGDAILALIPILGVVLLNTTLALSHYWGAWTDPVTSRFSLPLHLMMAICSTLVLYMIFKKREAPASLFLIAGIQVAVLTPIYCFHMRDEARLPIAEGYDWAMDWITSHAPPGNHLYLSQSAAGIGLLPVGAIPYSTANKSVEDVIRLRETGMYNGVFVVEALLFSDQQLSPLLPESGVLGDRYITETRAQHYVSDNLLYRISEVTGWSGPQGEEALDTAEQALRPEQVRDASFLKLLPLAP